MNTIVKNGLKINSKFFEFVNKEILPGTNINAEKFWEKFQEVVHELAPINKSLLKKRETIQSKIDEWHLKNKDKNFNKQDYTNFLKSIAYIHEEKEDFQIETSNVDLEISSIAGPQLVVPVDNARYALNAANARWGSLYDALYGTDALPGKKVSGYDAERALKVINYVRDFLNDTIPLSDTSWNEVTNIIVKGDNLIFLTEKKKVFLKTKISL